MMSFLQAIWWLSRRSLYLSLIADISETNVSNPFTLASTAAPAPLSPAPKITILFIYSNVLLLSDRQTLLSSFSSFLFRSSAAHIFLKLIIGLILSTILMLQISCIGQSVCSHRIFNVIIVIAASTIVTIQKRTVIFDS